MRAKFMIWREAISISPSGQHLSHYKLLFQPIDPRLEKPDRLKFQDMQDTITNMYCSMINYAIIHRYSFRRWQQIANTMILKEPNNVKVNRLCFIHIIEANLNLLTGIKFRDSVRRIQREGTWWPIWWVSWKRSPNNSIDGRAQTRLLSLNQESLYERP